jgi:hypothetical protein
MAAVSALVAGGAIAGMSLYQSAQQAESMRMLGEHQKGQFELNAQIGELQARDAKMRGDRNEILSRNRTKQTLGSQRAALAASGIDVNSGSAADIQKETTDFGAEDVITIRNNAWREAWGFKVQANNDIGRGQAAMFGANNDANNTILTGRMNAFSAATGSVRDYRQASRGGQ